MKISDCWFDAGEFVDIVDVFVVACPSQYRDDVCPHYCCGFHRVCRIHTLMFAWMIKEEGVSILVPDSGHQGDSPKLSPRAYVPGEDSYLGYTDLGCR